MNITVHVVSTCIPERGEGPCIPSVFATLAEAEAFADQMLRNEWDSAGMADEEGDDLPYPGDWRAANVAIAASYDDGSWGQWDLTSHPVEVQAPEIVTALELAAERLEISNYEGEEDSALATIRAAIALAKGGAA